MAFTKYASLESVQVLDIKGSNERIHHASLSKMADFEDYRTEDGYLYARIRAISSRVNKNHDGWPSVELAGSQDVFDRHQSSEGGFVIEASKDNEYGFSTFLGKPIFTDHHNSNPERTRGAIVDAKLHVEDHRTAAKLDPYYASAPDNHLPPTWVELLLEIDAKSFPKFAKAILEGSKNPKKGIDGFSMGCDVERSVCNICKNSATSPDEFCNHVKMKGAHFDYIDSNTGHKTSKRSYEDCYGIKFFEISGVFDPADETALLREVRASAQKESDLRDLQDQFESQPGPYGTEVKPSGLIECPQCGADGIDDYDRPCALCNSKGYLQPGTPGGDGAITPHRVKPSQVPLEPYENYNGIRNQGSVHTAENPLPQDDAIHAPVAIDTLREEKICPVCGSNMDEETCSVCGYIEPPDGFDNPDLEKAKQTDLKQDSENEGTDVATDVASPEADLGNSYGDSPTTTPTLSASTVGITNEMSWELTHPKVAGQINSVERPVLPNGSTTNEPKDTIIKDQTKPVTSSVRTASDFIAAAGATKRKTMNHTADAASGAPAVAKPDVNVEVTGVGGVEDASNEQASKADAQVDTLGIGGTGVDSVSAEKENVNVEQGNEHSKNIEGIHTDTWHTKERQHDPVSKEPFPASADGVKASAWVISDVHGVDPADPLFKPDERIDVSNGNAHSITTEDSGPTTTWSGTDGNGVLRQQDPVTDTTSDANQNSNSWSNDPGTKDYAFGDKSSHIFAAFKLADLEIDLGMLDSSRKYERVAELEQEGPEVVEASLKYAQRVKKSKVSTKKVANRVPPLGRPTIEHAASETQVSGKENFEDSALFI